MSLAELERAATAPRRWIALSSSKDRNEDGVLPSRTVRHLKGLTEHCSLYLVPGGRYLLTCSMKDLTVWDLGYVSDGNLFLEPTRIWVTKVTSIQGYFLYPTLDGLGIRILVHSIALHLFEIYPQKEITHDAKVAELKLEFLDDGDVVFYSYGNRIVIYTLRKGIVIVWDFVANTMASWSVDIPKRFYSMDRSYHRLFRATETSVMIRYCDHSMCIFQIPPLVPRTPLFGIEKGLPKVAPILTFEYFDTSACAGFPIPNSWYNDDISSFPIYFDLIENSQQDAVGRYKLNIASDFSTVFLTPTADRAPIPLAEYRYYSNQTAYKICENDFVTISLKHERNYGVARLTAITSGHEPYSDSRDSNQASTTHVNITPLVTRHRLQPALYSFCPASGRLVHGYHSGTRRYEYVICDFL